MRTPRNFRPPTARFEAGRKILDEARADLTDPHYRITYLSRLMGRFYQDYVEALVLQNDDAGALRIVESSRARVLAEQMESKVKAAENFPNPAALWRVLPDPPVPLF